MPRIRKPKKIPDHVRPSLDYIARDFAAAVRGVMERLKPFCDDYRALEDLEGQVVATMNRLNGRPENFPLINVMGSPGFKPGSDQIETCRPAHHGPVGARNIIR